MSARRAAPRRAPAGPDRSAATLEAVGLLAVVVAVQFFDPYGGFGPEADRRLFLSGLALVALPLAVWAARRAPAAEARAANRLVPGLALAGVAWAGLATALSIAPERSLFGALPRLDGWIAAATATTFLLVARAGLAEPERRARLADTLLAAAASTGALAILDFAGLAPARFAGQPADAAAALQGNPLFVGALLAPLVPLAVERLAAARRRADAEDTATSTVLLALLGGGLVASRSRGALLALAGGLAAQALLSARPLRRRRAAWVALGLAALAALALAGLADRPAATRGTLGQRRMVWRATGDLLAAEPGRLAIGFGPESLELALPRHLPDELAAAVWEPDRNQDRAHDRLLDAAAATGVVGAALAAALALAALAAALARDGGLATSGARRDFWLGALAGGGALGFAAGLGAPELALPAAAVGMPMGALLAAALRDPAGGSAPGGLTGGGAERLGGAALASALAIVWVAAATGVGSAASDTLFAFLAAAAAAPRAAPAAATDGARATAGDAADDGAARLWLAGLAAALVAWELWTLPQAGGGVAAAIRGAAIVGAAMVLVRALLPARGARPIPARPAGLVFGALAIAAVASAVAAGWRAGALEALFVAFFVVGALGLAAALARGAPSPGVERGATRGRLARVGAAACAVLAIGAGARLVVAPWRASFALGAGEALAGEGRFREALAPLAAATRRAPWLLDPALALARARLRTAVSEPEPAREVGLRGAEQTLAEAARRHPLAAEVAREQAYLDGRWAEGLADPAARRRRGERALASYARAAALDPTSSAVERGRGGLLLDLGRAAEALAAAERSARLAPRSLESRLLLGRARLANDDAAGGREAFAAALALDPVRPRRWLEAIARARPSDAEAQLEWALMEIAAGAPDGAAEPIAIARRVAPPELGARVASVAALAVARGASD